MPVPGAPRTGMVWVPPGTLRAGTPTDRIPRIPDEELPGVSIPMTGFYVDVLPYPNESGAIPTTNLPRAEAVRLCEARGKRLCSELEWERACKGANNTTYEYGDDYRPGTCGTGIPVEQSAKQPTGEKLACASTFGVQGMHGGTWEWTSSAWARGTTDTALGVLRGGNSVAGELVGRCANAIGRSADTRGVAMGFRCCAGPENSAKVELAIQRATPLEGGTKAQEAAAKLAPLIKSAWYKATDAGPPNFPRALLWHPVHNEEIVIAGGCQFLPVGLKCGAVIGRVGDTPQIVAEIDTGLDYPEIAQHGDARHLRVRGLEPRGGFLRDVTYAYGIVEVGARNP
jgi:hypothetical protein